MLDYNHLLADASRLPIGERIQLIEALWDTVPDDAAPPLTDEWMSEIQRRSTEFDSGLVATTPWEQIRSEARKRVARKG